MNAVAQVFALIYYSPIISVNNKQSSFSLSQIRPIVCSIWQWLVGYRSRKREYRIIKSFMG